MLQHTAAEPARQPNCCAFVRVALAFVARKIESYGVRRMTIFEVDAAGGTDDVVGRCDQGREIRNSLVAKGGKREQAWHGLQPVRSGDGLCQPGRVIAAKNSVWMLDLDGVVWRGSTAIDGSVAAIDRLRAADNRVMFVSNNSSLTVGDYQAKLASVGIDAQPHDICTSAMAAAGLVEPGTRAMVLGGAGINEALLVRGVEPVDAEIAAASTVQAVVVGLDRQLTYERLTAAVRAVLAGATLVVTNEDPTFPTEDGFNAGGGSIGAAVAYGAGVTSIVAGKPHRPIAALILERTNGVMPAVMVGDQPLTDGQFAKAMGVPFGLVLSGVASTADGVEPTPAIVAANLASLVEAVGLGRAVTGLS